MKQKLKKLWLPFVIFVSLMLMLIFGTYNTLNNMTKDIIVSYINEFADHDMDKICEFVADKQDSIYGVYNEMKVRNIKSVWEAQEELNIKVYIKNYDHLYLIDSEGRLYTDTHLIYDREDNYFLEYFNTDKTEFVMRFDDKNRFHEQKKEYMFYGLNFRDDPIVIADTDVKFVGMVMLNDISKIRTRMRITSFADRGYASVIDLDGNYIVTEANVSGLDRFKNFYEMIKSYRIEGYTCEEIVEKANDEKEEISFWCVTPDNVRKFISVKPIEDLGWNFISSISEEVFTEQTNQFVIFVTTIMLLMLIILGIVIITSRHFQKKLYNTPVDNVYNKQYYYDKLVNSKVTAIAIMDLDHLKYINDNYGHSAGDDAITRVALALSRNVGTEGKIVRFGGDEFIIVFQEDIEPEYFKSVLEAVLDDVNRARLSEYPDIKLTLSVGGFLCAGIADEQLKYADKLLYEAKKKRNCIVTNID